MWSEFMSMTIPALVGSGVTFTGIILSSRVKNKKLNMEVDAAQDFV